MTREEREQALEWFKNRPITMSGAKKMYDLAFEALSADGDTISRQAAINVLNVGAELLRRVLDDADIVGAEREKYKWGLGLIESCISDINELPPAEPEIIQCRNCKFASGDSRICMKFGHSPIGELDFCAWAERRTDE